MALAAPVRSPVVEVPVTDLQLARASMRHERVNGNLQQRGKKCFNNSIEEGRGTLGGLLGEEVTYDFFTGPQPAWERTPENNPYHFDLILRGRSPITVDVKTKRQEYDGAPAPHYFATVCAKNIEQVCDIYWFVRVHTAGEKAWILGWLPKKEFFRIALFFKKGDLDPTSHLGWRFREDCYNVSVRQLWRADTPAALQEAWAHYTAVDGSK